jgi:hypothetical protein
VECFSKKGIIDKVSDTEKDFNDIEIEPAVEFGEKQGIFPYDSPLGYDVVVKIIGCGDSGEKERVKGDQGDN